MGDGHEDWSELLRAAVDAITGGDYQRALYFCDRAAPMGEDARYQSALIRGDALLRMGEAKAALSCYESIADVRRKDPEVDFARGTALFALARLPQADSALRSCLLAMPDLADAYYVRALIAELLGTGEESELFRRARRLEPERFPYPKHMPRHRFETLLAGVLESLSERDRARLEDIDILIAELPHPEDLSHTQPPAAPTTLGLFLQAPPDATMPQKRGTFLLYKRNIERAFAGEAEMRQEIRTQLIQLARPLRVV